MRKSEFIRYKSRLLPSLSKVYKQLDVPLPAEPEPVFARITTRHLYRANSEDCYIDAPRKLVDCPPPNQYAKKNRLPTPLHLRHKKAKPGRTMYFKFENVRFERQLALVMEEIMDNEIALRSQTPIVQWEPDGQVKWTDKLTHALLDHIANGGTYLSFAANARISRAAVVAFAQREEIAPLIAKAAQLGVDAMAEAALEIAGRPCMVEEVIETVAPDGTLMQKNVRRRDQVDARKLAYESRMRYLSKIAPNRYGDKPEVTQTEGMADKILKARKRLASG